jgi:uncharacterized damage-inducible protein DinB
MLARWMHMSQVSLWFEREFDFGFPAEMLPNVLSRLRGAPVRLEETLAGRPRKVLVAKPEGKWSAQEHAGHLLELEGLWLARVEDYAVANDGLTVADLLNRGTDAAGYNERAIGEILAGFRRARGKLLERVGKLDAAAFVRAIVHPRLKKPMRLVDHLYFVAEHDDHHLARIWEMVEGGEETPA